ncbi:ricin-type beta-trefoil lectin domain protein [Streptomyces sp. BE20]|uniref:ricin-type beta-trefoil lectin domain protein n=1 Tax=Streptomyces sp. BE20 TaxID=3002525 RepID=UPI002E77C559|nr:ricin-type beta-trefoil lectin domain protein [Streptomyces sp. BE20]MEE1820930.1 ricin-type beta-trefoil lectin domain protein [Streptomyces sp. BE20]
MPGTAAEAAQRAAEAAALAEARRSGKPVEIAVLTTETDTVVANPNGTLGLRRTVAPARAKRDGVWKDLDATLARASDGTLRPRVTSNQLTFSGGGSGPLATLDQDGRKLALSWPGALPAPTLDGESATYAEVAPGVDLKLTANQAGGFAQVLVVKTPAAAQDPKVKAIALGLKTEGVSVSADAGGNLNATDADGRVVFRAPAPTMWDSSTTAAPAAPASASAKSGARAARSAADAPAAAPAADSEGLKVHSDADGPGLGANVSQLSATPAGTSLTVTPDSAFLDAPTTTYPVYIDPTWTPTNRGTQNWTWVQEAYPTVTHYNDYGNAYDPGVGYQQWQTKKGLERYYIQLDAGDLGDKVIRKAALVATQSYAAANNCASTYGVTLHPTHPIDGSTSWNNQPWDWGSLGTATLNSAGGDGCPGATTTGEWDVRQHLSDNNWRGLLSFGLFAADESKRDGNNGNISFKRFTRTPAKLPYLYVEYNRAPYAPWSLGMSPAPQNPNGNGCGWIGATNAATGIRLSAWVGDPDSNQIDARFEVRDLGTADEPVAWDSGWGNLGNSNHEAAVTPGNLQDGHTYYWRVQTGDGELPSGWSAGCQFSLDLTPPAVPTVTSADYPASGTLPGSTKHIGEAGAFTLDATDNASGVLYYEYAFNSAIPVGGANRVDASGNGSAVINLTPTMWGTNLLRVQAVDRAGNRSQENTYSFFAPSDPNAKTVLGDITNDAQVDLVLPDNNGNLMLYPAGVEPSFGGPMASDKANSPGGRGWDKALVTHRGGNGIRIDDLIVYADSTLYSYRNSLWASSLQSEGNLYFSSRNAVLSRRPMACSTIGVPGASCVGYHKTDWSRVKGLLAIGDIDTVGIPDPTADKRRYDLLTQEDDGAGHVGLWLFRSSSATGVYASGTPLSTADWSNRTLIAPGDATGDGLIDLWVRENGTGNIYQYPSRKLPDGKPDITALVDDSTRTLIGHASAADFPKLTSSGDVSGDGVPDLWTRDTSGVLNVWSGITSTGKADAPVTGFLSAAALGYPGGTISFHAGANTNKCMDANGSADGSRLQLYNCWNGDNQHFTFRTDGTLRTLDKCVTADNTYNGASVNLRTCVPDAPGQKWTLRQDNTLYNPDSGRCIDDMTAGGSDGVQLWLWNCHSYSNQKWISTANRPVNLHSGANNSKCMDANGPDEGSQIQLYDCWNGLNQRYDLRTDKTVRVYEKCVTADGAANGSPVTVRSCTGADNQKWELRGDGTLYNPVSDRCVDDMTAGGQNMVPLWMWSCHSFANQRWTTA